MTIPEDIHSLALKVLEFKTMVYTDKKWYVYNPDNGIYIKCDKTDMIQQLNDLCDVLPEYDYYIDRITYKKQALKELQKLCTRTVEFDKHSHLLGMPNGVLDLSTREVRPGKPSEYITMVTSVPYSPDTPTENIEKVLKEVFPVDLERIRALSIFAKSLYPTEDSPVLNYSKTCSGKTTMQRLLADTLNDYSTLVAVPIKTLLNPKGYLKNKRHAYCEPGIKELTRHLPTLLKTKFPLSVHLTSYILPDTHEPMQCIRYRADFSEKMGRVHYYGHAYESIKTGLLKLLVERHFQDAGV